MPTMWWSGAAARKRWFSLAAILVLTLSLGTLALQAAAAADRNPVILSADALVGNPRPYIGAANPIRGINAGGLPWVVRDAKAQLKADGQVRVEVEGLVLNPNDPEVVSRGLAGTNPLPSFAVLVSCLAVDANGAATTVNLLTAPAAATSSGDSVIRAKLALPHPCVAPLLFVTTPTGAWLASTGF